MPLNDEAIETQYVATDSDDYLIEVPSAGQVSTLGWDLPPDLTKEQWIGFGKKLGRSERSLGWWIGDWWVYGLSAYNNNAKKIIESPDWTGPSYKTCQKFALCCKTFPMPRRRGIVPIWQHYALRKLPEEQQDQMLNEAAEHAYLHGTPPTVKQLREQIKASSLADNAAEIADKQEIHRAQGLYPLGFCDPLWTEFDEGRVFAERNRQPPLDQEAAVMFMMTGTDISTACAVLTGWGFDNVGSIVLMLGRQRPTAWTKEEHRVLLIGARGEIKPQYIPPSTTEASSITATIKIITDMFPYIDRRVQCLGRPIPGFDNWRAA